jgi:hypothetical protein
LNAANCQLVDQTPYAAYRLDLPVRGQIKIELAGNTTDFVLTLRDASGMRVDSGTSLFRPIDAGSYTLLVNGRTAGQTGNYTAKSSFTSEPAFCVRTFPISEAGRPRWKLGGSDAWLSTYALRGLHCDHGRRAF